MIQCGPERVHEGVHGAPAQHLAARGEDLLREEPPEALELVRVAVYVLHFLLASSTTTASTATATATAATKDGSAAGAQAKRRGLPPKEPSRVPGSSACVRVWAGEESSARPPAHRVVVVVSERADASSAFREQRAGQ